MSKVSTKAIYISVVIILTLIMNACGGSSNQPDTSGPIQPAPKDLGDISSIRVEQVQAVKTILAPPESFPLPNCGGTGELSVSLGTQATVQRRVAIGAKATTSAGGEVEIPMTVKLKLEAEVELAYQQTYATTNSRLDTIQMKAAPGTEVVYEIEWEEQKFTSTVSYIIGGDAYTTAYTYILRVPKLKGSRPGTNCPSSIPPTLVPTNTLPPTLVPTNTPPPTSTPEPFKLAFLGKWGSEGDNDGQFRRPWGIGVSWSVGMVYVGDDGQASVQVFSSSGEFLGRLPGEIIGNFLAVDSNGLIYARNYDPATGRNERIEIFSPGGHELMGTFKLKGSAPRGIDVDIYGENIYVTDISEQKVYKYGPDGEVLAEWGSMGDSDGQFRNPWGIAVDRYQTGRIYVADTGNNRVQVFSSDGRFLKQWGTHGTGDGQFDSPIDVAVDTSRGNVYVLDRKNARVQVFNPEGDFLGKWGAVGRNDSEFLDPYGIVIDGNDNVYVLDSGNYRVQVFRVSFTR